MSSSCLSAAHVQFLPTWCNQISAMLQSGELRTGRCGGEGGQGPYAVHAGGASLAVASLHMAAVHGTCQHVCMSAVIWLSPALDTSLPAARHA